MIDFFKEKIASYVVERQLRQKHQPGISFTNFFSSSFRFFVVMPEDEKDFLHSFEVLNFLESKNKNVLVFTYEFKVSLLPIKFRQNVFGRAVTDITRWKLPTKNLQTKLNELVFDVSIDLNRKENLYCSLAANLVNSPIRVGFKKDGSDEFYNLQVTNVEDNSEISYKNFLNCLSMF